MNIHQKINAKIPIFTPGCGWHLTDQKKYVFLNGQKNKLVSTKNGLPVLWLDFEVSESGMKRGHRTINQVHIVRKAHISEFWRFIKHDVEKYIDSGVVSKNF